MDVAIPCPCPARDGEPRHAQDTVTLRDTLDFRSVTAIRHAIGFIERDGGSLYEGEVLAVLTEGYIVYGIESWTLVDDRGRPVEVSREAIRSRILADVVTAATIGDAADSLYGEKVLLPLLVRASTSSPPTPTSASTSRSTGSRRSRPTPSKRSSTSTSRTDGIETTSTSLAGVSSSSQSSGTAA